MKDLGVADVISGIRIHRTPQGLALSQSHYIEKVLGKFKYMELGIVKTPLDASFAFRNNEGESDSQLEYARVLGCLMYIMNDYGVAIVLFHSNLLVDIEVESVGRVLKLDSIKSGQIWKEFDLLIFNTWLWYTRTPPGQQWDCVEVGVKLLKDMNRVEAFRAGLNTWARWVDTDVDTAKTKVFFQGTSPAHYQ
ncbi:Protein trichome birefringence-like 41 [Capsicum baccatum]|uniref:Protein trichome birefringence-like 41 n=1 Tax=Capsicum baccatum TaxID=33114 RepID=A0A2G2VPZ6_CAPBA|nr:Protein trichome birefringence-like 41 [Capsicum baccatum]